MIEIIAGTDRPNSRTLAIAQHVLGLMREQGASAQILSLHDLNLADLAGGAYFQGARGSFKDAVERVTNAEGLVVIVPEYNGSYPGILKLFIDYWRYPETFEHRPVAMIGLGARWGGLRAVEHLQQCFGYRNAYVYPNRVFIANVKDAMTGSAVSDPAYQDLLRVQAVGFVKFISALQHKGLDANSIRAGARG